MEIIIDRALRDVSEPLEGVVWRKEGSALIRALMHSLGDCSFEPWQPPWVPQDRPWVIGHLIKTPSISSTLLLFYVAEDDVRAVAAAPPGAEEVDASSWSDELSKALKKVRGDAPRFDWYGVISPTKANYGLTPRVSNGGEVGPINVAASTSPYTEVVESREYPQLNTASVETVHPVIIRSTSAGYDWDVVTRGATISSNRVCAIFSLAYNCYWRIRNMVERDRGHPIKLPEFRLPARSDMHEHYRGSQQDVELLPWFSKAYSLAETSAAVSRALHAHRHALMLEQDSPSFSLVSYVAAIEGLGEKLSSETESKARFRAALATAHSEEEVEDLESLYRPRSGTAHTGRLYGDEPALGSMRLGLLDLFTPRAMYDNFRDEELVKARRASKAVLVKLFAGDAPANST